MAIVQEFRKIIEDENLTWSILFHPGQVVSILLRHRFLHFLLVGGGGAGIGIGSTWLLTTYVFGIERYFSAYLLGTTAAPIFNFTMYSIVIFKTTREHVRRLVVYLLYIIGIITVQALSVKTITPIVGLRWYLLVIAMVVGFFSIINFLVFKLAIFKDRRSSIVGSL